MIGLLYMIYSFLKYDRIIKNGVQVEKFVISQSCRAYTKLASGVTISDRNKKYNIKLDYGNCVRYPKNSKIKLVYDKDSDTYIYPVKTQNYGKVYFLGCILILSLLPWSYMIRKKIPQK